MAWAENGCTAFRGRVLGTKPYVRSTASGRALSAAPRPRAGRKRRCCVAASPATAAPRSVAASSGQSPTFDRLQSGAHPARRPGHGLGVSGGVALPRHRRLVRGDITAEAQCTAFVAILGVAQICWSVATVMFLRGLTPAGGASPCSELLGLGGWEVWVCPVTAESNRGRGRSVQSHPPGVGRTTEPAQPLPFFPPT